MLKNIIKIGFLLALGVLATAFEARAFNREFHIDYRLDSINIDTAYMENRMSLQEVDEFLQFLQDNKFLHLDSISFSGTASPDGYIERNQWLSRNRLEVFKRLMDEQYAIPDSLIVASDTYIPWQRFRRGVEASDIPYREEVLEVLALPADTVKWYKGMHTDSRLLTLRAMNRGQVWETLKPILARNRFATADFAYHILTSVPTLETAVTTNFPLPEITFFPQRIEYETWVRRMYIKTNFVQWAFAIVNAGVEVDVARHWSVALPIVYSCWNYFSPKIRFRVAGFQPEVRYWFNHDENSGWYLNGHFGYTYYNMSFNGADRFQDYEGKTPTMGGGIGFGWRKHFGKGRRWLLEFGLGAGVYPLHYDVFENTEDYKKGPLIDTRKKTLFCIDQAAVTIGYTIPLHTYTKIKGGKK